MPKISKRTIAVMAKALELGYTRDRIDLFFERLDVPKDILDKYAGGKEIYSTRVMYDLHDGTSDDGGKLLIVIATDLLSNEGANAKFYRDTGGFSPVLGKLELSLQNDGFKLIDNRLVPIVDEDFEQEESLLKQELTKLNFNETIKYLDDSYDNFISGKWESANAMTRNVLEKTTMEIAERIAKKKEEPPSFKGHKQVRTYLRENILDDHEFNILTHVIHWCSTKGPHPGMSDENECRLRRILVTSLCQYYLEKWQTEYCH